MTQPTNETHEYTVQGMTCSHCVVSVREEMFDVGGVTAVVEAGYEVAA
jgi:copper chaperone